ncbi:MAG: sulfotransferase [Parvularculaceae bacterium]|nr:sulfotransferase [Parvularculaceae bacterium]
MENPRTPNPIKGGAPDIERYLHDISFNRVVKKIGFKTRPELGYAGMIQDMVYQLRDPARKLSINIHRNFSRIPEFFPGACYVHLVRDPRDVARSAVGMGWAGNVYHGVDHWTQSERDFEKLAAMVPAGRILRLKNEDLIADPVRELTRLCTFLGVAYDPAMLTYPATTTYAAPDPALSFQWRKALTAREIGLVETKIGPMLAARGYQPSGQPPQRPGPWGRIALRTSDRWNRWRLMAQRQGVLLMVVDMVARRLPPTPFSDFTRRLRAERAAKYLQ